MYILFDLTVLWFSWIWMWFGIFYKGEPDIVKDFIRSQERGWGIFLMLFIPVWFPAALFAWACKRNDREEIFEMLRDLF
jgi:hypothetical protein